MSEQLTNEEILALRRLLAKQEALQAAVQSFTEGKSTLVIDKVELLQAGETQDPGDTTN